MPQTKEALAKLGLREPPAWYILLQQLRQQLQEGKASQNLDKLLAQLLLALSMTNRTRSRNPQSSLLTQLDLTPPPRNPNRHNTNSSSRQVSKRVRKQATSLLRELGITAVISPTTQNGTGTGTDIVGSGSVQNHPPTRHPTSPNHPKNLKAKPWAQGNKCVLENASAAGAALASSPLPGTERPLERAVEPAAKDDCPASQAVNRTTKGQRVVISGRDMMEKFLPVSQENTCGKVPVWRGRRVQQESTN